MLGRGHLSTLRQGRGSWPDRESFVSTPVTGREDMVLMDGQLERDSLPAYCPTSRPQKCFSPPKRPWDFSKATQPKRLWDFSPPFCKGSSLASTRPLSMVTKLELEKLKAKALPSCLCPYYRKFCRFQNVWHRLHIICPPLNMIYWSLENSAWNRKEHHTSSCLCITCTHTHPPC